jgi:hypothetical protein
MYRLYRDKRIISSNRGLFTAVFLSEKDRITKAARAIIIPLNWILIAGNISVRGALLAMRFML